MDLTTQFQVLIYSFAYGVFFSITFNYNYRFLFGGRKIFMVITNVLFVFNHSLLYFILLEKINNGVVHPYLFIMLLIGFLFGNYYSKRKRR